LGVGVVFTTKNNWCDGQSHMAVIADAFYGFR